MDDLAEDQLSLALFSDDDDYDSRSNSRSSTTSTSSIYGGNSKPYSKHNGGVSLSMNVSWFPYI
jgi:hypothetical protein